MTCLFLLGILGQLVKTSVAVPSNSPRQAVACRGHTGCSKPDAFCLHLQPEKLRHSADMIASELPRQSIDNCPLALPPIAKLRDHAGRFREFAEFYMVLEKAHQSPPDFPITLLNRWKLFWHKLNKLMVSGVFTLDLSGLHSPLFKRTPLSNNTACFYDALLKSSGCSEQ